MEDESLFFSSIEETTVAANIEVQEAVTTIIEKENIEEIPQNSNKPKRELPKSSSLGSMFSTIHQEVVTVKDENKVELTSESVVTIWNEFLAEHKNSLQGAFLNVANSQTPELVEDKVTFILSNNISLEMLQLHKMDITAYYRKRTTSTTVVPDFVLKREESVQKAYKTQKDRLKEIINTNPAVLKLIEKFDLNEY